jgi:hypothetical protein
MAAILSFTETGVLFVRLRVTKTQIFGDLCLLLVFFREVSLSRFTLTATEEEDRLLAILAKRLHTKSKQQVMRHALWKLAEEHELANAGVLRPNACAEKPKTDG